MRCGVKLIVGSQKHLLDIHVSKVVHAMVICVVDKQEIVQVSFGIWIDIWEQGLVASQVVI
jgi:hypothetical protein